MRNACLPAILASAVLVAASFSCKRGTGELRSLTDVNPFVYGYTSGVVSKASAVRIQFAETVVEPGEVGQAARKDLLEISPSVEGTLIWEDDRTLRFDPEMPLPAATTFSVQVAVQKAIPRAKGEDADFAFAFRTRDQFARASVDGLFYPNERDYSRIQIRGTVRTADQAEPEAVSKMLEASQRGSTLKVAWEHSTDRMTHYFRIDGASRGERESEVSFRWSGKPIGAPLDEKETLTIPALGDFTLLDAEVVQGEEQYVLCEFSDPLLADQVLDGLLALEGYEGALRYLIESNRVRVYPENSLYGSFRLAARQGLRNSKDAGIRQEAFYDLRFESVEPQVRLTGNGVIMPHSNGLRFPFEAVGLTSVDVEVFKIYHNNILQFLQDNAIDGTYDLYKVGRIVLQQKINLESLNPSAEPGKWHTYALDLEKLVGQDEQAIYSIRIGFRPEYAALDCMKQQGAKEEDAFTRTPKSLEFEDEEEVKSILDYWYGAEGWTEEYNWDNRDNPCASEYYHSDRFVQRNVLASNLGLIAKSGGDRELWAVATDLRSAEPMSRVELELYDYQHQLIGKGTSDQEGMARVSYKGKPFLLLAKQGKERGYLRLTDGEALDISRFDVDGAPVQKGLKGFLYGERGVWRPGDSVFLNFVLDDRSGKLPESYPISVELFNARGQLQEKRTTSRSVGGIYPLHFATRRDAPTGNWQVKVKAGGALFEKVLKIETVKPNRIEIDLAFGKNRLGAPAEGLSGKLQAQWLHGAPASGMSAIVEAQLSAAKTSFPKFPSFSFNDPARKLESGDPIVLFDGKLDGTGAATVSAGALSVRDAPGMLNAAFRTRVFEPGGDFSTDNVVLPYSPYPAYAGVEIPKNKYGEPQIETGKSTPLRFALADPEGKPLANRTLSVGVYAVEWRWWWDQYDEQMSNYNSSTHYNAKGRFSVNTNAQGIATWPFAMKQWGRYLVRVCDEQGGHCAGGFIYVGNPWQGGAEDAGYRDVAAMLNFKSDKESYKPGETATLTIPGGKSGRILVSIENGTRVLQAFWASSKPGENQVSFKVTPEMAPNVYAHVSLLQPHGQVANDLPIRLYGVAPIQVEDPATRLLPEIKMPAVLKPEQSFQVEVREKTGKAMAYTLAVVDEGLLGLTRFQTPDPREVFYAREALGVHSWDLYNSVLGAYGGALENVVAIGGDQALDPSALNNTANRFEPVVRHLGPFELKPGAGATHRIAMPNYVGAVRVMVVAASKGAYGKAEQRAKVQNPLMVLATAPRVLSPGDVFQIPVNVFANEAGMGNVQVSIRDKSGKTAPDGASSASLRFAKTGSQMAFFPVRVKNTKGVARFEITATSNGEKARQEIEIEIRNPNPYTTTVYSEVLEPGESWNPDLVPVGVPGTQSGLLEVSAVLPLNLGKRLDYLLQYPYGCLEQTVSAGFPQLFTTRLMDLSPEDQKKADEHIKATLERIKGFQTAEGGFAYWPGESTPDAWTTSYAGHFMLEAKDNGYAVPQNLLSDWVKFQKKAARVWDPKLPALGYGSEEAHQLTQSYRLYTLALAGQADLASMNRLRESGALLQAARWRLAAAYAVAGKMEIARQLVQDQDLTVQSYRELSATYGSDLRDRALMLETLWLIKDKKRAAQIAGYISDELASSGWYSTQSTAQALVAMARYAGENKLANGFSFTWQMPGGKSVQGGSKNALMQVQLPAAQLRAGKAAVKNTGKSRLYVRFILKGQSAPGEEPAGANDLNIAVTFKNLDGSILQPANLPQGKDFVAEVKVSHPGARPMPYQELALAQVFPSGWEIINTRMGDLSAGTQSGFDYQDFRDDRVNTFFDLSENQSKVFRVQLNAAYPGKYYLPATSCSAMYDESVSASVKGQWVSVVR